MFSDVDIWYFYQLKIGKKLKDNRARQIYLIINGSTDMNITKDLIEKERKLYDSQMKSVEERRQDWGSFSERAKKIFTQFLSEFDKQTFFDQMYIDEGIPPFIERKNQRTITLKFGSHPTGIGTTEFCPDGKFKSVENQIERGGALHYSQAPNGQIVCIIYGCKSELIKAKDEWFIFKRYNSPEDINEKELIKATRAFFWYTRITSFITHFSILDTYKLDFYKVRSFTSKPDWNAIFGLIGVISAIFTIISFIV